MLLVIAPAVSGAALFGWLNLRHAQSGAEQRTASLARLATTMQADLIRDTRTLVATLASLPSVRHGTSSECVDTLSQAVQRNSMLASIDVVSGNGQVRCRAIPLGSKSSARPATYRHLPADQRHPATETYWSSDRTGAFGWVAPIGTGTNSATGAIYARLRPDWLSRIAASAGLPKDATLMLTNRRGEIVAEQAPSGAAVKPDYALLSQLTSQPGGRHFVASEHTGPHGARHFYAVSALADDAHPPRLYMTIGMPDSPAVAAARHALAENLAIIGAMAVLLLLIGWVVSDRLVLRKVAALSGAVHRLSGGDLQARTRLEGKDEIARLGQAFDRMADLLATQNARLREHSRRVERLNRIHRVLSGINAAILRLHHEDALLQEACRIAVEVGGLPLAWSGRVDKESGCVRLVAHAGKAHDVIESFTLSADASVAESRGTIGSTLRTRQPVVCNDIVADKDMEPWQAELLANDCRAVATFPLLRGDESMGNFTIYAAETDHFDSEEVGLYEEVVSNISLGLQFASYEAQREYLAYHDPTTGLPNRALFRDRIEQAILSARRKGNYPAVLALEIPEMQKIADRFGHHLADEALRAITPRLAAALREDDTLARLEGHAFAIGLIAQMKTPDDAQVLAARILTIFPLDLEVDGKSFLFTARIGLSVYSVSGDDVQTMIRNAELAVHTLEAGRRIGFYSRELDQSLHRRHEIEQALARADPDEEFRLVYQPVVDLATGRIVGAEALVRWHSATLGDVSPGEFIPIAEQVGRIESVGRWVLRRVLRQIRDWQHKKLAFGTMSVNLAASELRQDDLVEAVSKLLSEAGIDPHECPIALELTETTAVEGLHTAAEVLRELRNLGLQIYLDDFGTGYSSLVHLQRFPGNALKIDLEFIRRLTEDEVSLSVTRGSIMLAHSLGLKAIAEGVEHTEQIQLLKGLGCDEAQGFLFGAPMPPDQFVNLLDGSKAA